MRATEVLADPLVEVTAAILTVPIVQLYALLWRAGLLEAKHPPAKRRPAEATALRPAS